MGGFKRGRQRTVRDGYLGLWLATLGTPPREGCPQAHVLHQNLYMDMIVAAGRFHLQLLKNLLHMAMLSVSRTALRLSQATVSRHLDRIYMLILNITHRSDSPHVKDCHAPRERAALRSASGLHLVVGVVPCSTRHPFNVIRPSLCARKPGRGSL